MSNNILYRSLAIVQPVLVSGTKLSPKDGKSMSTNSRAVNSLRLFVCSLISENATHVHDHFVLYAEDLSLIDQQLFLSRLCCAEDYADFCADDTRLQAAIEEFLPEMQFFIDENIDDVYRESMEEAGLVWSRTHGEYEGRWVRR